MFSTKALSYELALQALACARTATSAGQKVREEELGHKYAHQMGQSSSDPMISPNGREATAKETQETAKSKRRWPVYRQPLTASSLRAAAEAL